MDSNIKTEMVAVGRLLAGDFIVNLGSLVEIEEKETYFSLVIQRMDQRQVWQFVKSEDLLVRIA
jgi:hypothetical protein